MRPIIRVDIKIPIEVFPEGDMFISYAPTFDVSSQGESVNEAREHLIDALTGFILTCHEMGTLSQVMKESGFVPCALPDLDGDADPDVEFIDIPLPFMLADKKSSACRV